MIFKTPSNQRWKHIDLVVFTVITTMSIAYGKTSVFYILYLFWWSELIRKVVGNIFVGRQKRNLAMRNPTNSMGSFFLLIIYFVFVVVFFGIMANWANTDIMLINFEIFLFKNWFFNANLLWILGENIWIFKKGKGKAVDLSPFSSNVIVMHISIIIAGLIMFFIVKQFPVIFEPESLWGSVLIAAPFLLLRLIAEVYFKNIKASDVE